MGWVDLRHNAKANIYQYDTPSMIVDESKFYKMAKSLGMDAEDIINTILDNIKKNAWYVHRAGLRRSLDKALEITINNSEIAYAWDEAIKHIVGGREYVVDDADVDLRNGNVWYEIVFPEGTDSEIDRLDLYFGSDSREVVSASVRVDLDGTGLEKALEEIGTELGSAMSDCDDVDFEHDCNDGIFSFSIIAYTGRDFYLPGFNETNGLVKKIKEIVKLHGAQN